jgi:hypothetical protein
MLIRISAIVFSGLTGIVVLFQLALACGMPWGEYSMGGKFKGKYPPKMRIVALMNAAVMAFVGMVVLARAEFFLPSWYSFSKIAIWFVVGFSVIALVLNSITHSIWERRIWVPVTAGMLITSVVVAVG